MKVLSDQVSEAEIMVIRRELQATLDAATPGDVVEFGCYVGTTSVHLAQLLCGSDRKLWLYDSFEGLPEKTRHDESPAGEQFVAGELHATRRQLERNLREFDRQSIRITKGWFSELSSSQIPQQVAFAFLDGDYYHSILDPLRLVWERLSPGATIVVDDYANEALPGAAKAVDDWARQHGIAVRQEKSLAIFHKHA